MKTLLLIVCIALLIAAKSNPHQVVIKCDSDDVAKIVAEWNAKGYKVTSQSCYSHISGGHTYNSTIILIFE